MPSRRELGRLVAGMRLGDLQAEVDSLRLRRELEELERDREERRREREAMRLRAVNQALQNLVGGGVGVLEALDAAERRRADQSRALAADKREEERLQLARAAEERAARLAEQDRLFRQEQAERAARLAEENRLWSVRERALQRLLGQAPLRQTAVERAFERGYEAQGEGGEPLVLPPIFPRGAKEPSPEASLTEDRLARDLAEQMRVELGPIYDELREKGLVSEADLEALARDQILRAKAERLERLRAEEAAKLQAAQRGLGARGAGGGRGRGIGGVGGRRVDEDLLRRASEDVRFAQRTVGQIQDDIDRINLQIANAINPDEQKALSAQLETKQQELQRAIENLQERQDDWVRVRLGEDPYRARFEKRQEELRAALEERQKQELAEREAEERRKQALEKAGALQEPWRSSTEARARQIFEEAHAKGEPISKADALVRAIEELPPSAWSKPGSKESGAALPAKKESEVSEEELEQFISQKVQEEQQAISRLGAEVERLKKELESTTDPIARRVVEDELARKQHELIQRSRALERSREDYLEELKRLKSESSTQPISTLR